MASTFRPKDWLRSLKRRLRFKKRYDVINYFIHARRTHSYLEIGVRTGTCFRRVRCSDKVGVDPKPGAVDPGWQIHKTTSDDFFAANQRTFDVVFIDGLHLAEQALRDIFNALACVAPQGVVVLHDCNPATKRAQTRDLELARAGEQWNGDVWKAVAYVREHCDDVFCRVLDIDQGVGVIIPTDSFKPRALTDEDERRAQEFFETLSWKDLVANRTERLGLIAGRRELERQLRLSIADGSGSSS
jgi:hypothetical protein